LCLLIVFKMFKKFFFIFCISLLLFSFVFAQTAPAPPKVEYKLKGGISNEVYVDGKLYGSFPDALYEVEHVLSVTPDGDQVPTFYFKRKEKTAGGSGLIILGNTKIQGEQFTEGSYTKANGLSILAVKGKNDITIGSSIYRGVEDASFSYDSNGNIISGEFSTYKTNLYGFNYKGNKVFVTPQDSSTISKISVNFGEGRFGGNLVKVEMGDQVVESYGKFSGSFDDNGASNLVFVNGGKFTDKIESGVKGSISFFSDREFEYSREGGRIEGTGVSVINGRYYVDGIMSFTHGKRSINGIRDNTQVVYFPLDKNPLFEVDGMADISNGVLTVAVVNRKVLFPRSLFEDALKANKLGETMYVKFADNKFVALGEKAKASIGEETRYGFKPYYFLDRNGRERLSKYVAYASRTSAGQQVADRIFKLGLDKNTALVLAKLEDIETLKLEQWEKRRALRRWWIRHDAYNKAMFIPNKMQQFLL